MKLHSSRYKIGNWQAVNSSETETQIEIEKLKNIYEDMKTKRTTTSWMDGNDIDKEIYFIFLAYV